MLLKTGSVNLVSALRNPPSLREEGGVLEDNVHLLLSGISDFCCHVGRYGDRVTHLLVAFAFNSRFDFVDCGVSPLFLF